MTKELREMSYDQLIEYSAQVFKEVRRRAYGEGYRQGKFDAEMDATCDRGKAKTIDESIEILAQRKRDRIVEQAKKDVEELKDGRIGFEYLRDGFGVNAEFIVNREKRTVVCLLKGFSIPVIYAKGIAKCAPDDCFNVHIGKVISLRRALGLEVPMEYLNAPQPTEVRVGDVVKFDGRHITVCPGDRLYRHYEDLCALGSVVAETSEIIDDSREV